MARRSGEDRRRSLANLAGADAERLALVLLVCKGYWPMARRYLAPSGEIDLIKHALHVLYAFTGGIGVANAGHALLYGYGCIRHCTKEGNVALNY